MRTNKKTMIQAVILLVALGLIIMGALQGGYEEVWHKAMMICYECIGIG